MFSVCAECLYLLPVFGVVECVRVCVCVYMCVCVCMCVCECVCHLHSLGGIFGEAMLIPLGLPEANTVGILRTLAPCLEMVLPLCARRSRNNLSNFDVKFTPVIDGIVPTSIHTAEPGDTAGFQGVFSLPAARTTGGSRSEAVLLPLQERCCCNRRWAVPFGIHLSRPGGLCSYSSSPLLRGSPHSSGVFWEPSNAACVVFLPKSCQGCATKPCKTDQAANVGTTPLEVHNVLHNAPVFLTTFSSASIDAANEPRKLTKHRLCSSSILPRGFSHNCCLPMQP